MIEIKVLASSSRGNAHFITDGFTPVLLECGINYKDIQRGLSFQVSQLAGCLVSHEHKDHCKSIQDLMKAGIDCYMSRGTAEMLQVGSHRVKLVEAKMRFVLGSWVVLPFNTQHDAREPLGFLMANSSGDKLLYLTDTMYCKYRFDGLTHIMLEVNYSAEILRANVACGALDPQVKRRTMRSHMSLETAKEFLKANDLCQVREIHLLHLSDGNSDAERFKSEIQGITGKEVYVAGE